MLHVLLARNSACHANLATGEPRTHTIAQKQDLMEPVESAPPWFVDASFVDAFSEYEVGLERRRALACVCKTQRDVQRAFFLKARSLRVGDADCTQFNAEFVLGWLAEHNPKCGLQVRANYCLPPLHKLPERIDVDLLDDDIASFFVGRAFARRCSGTLRYKVPGHARMLATEVVDIDVEALIIGSRYAGFPFGHHVPDLERDVLPVIAWSALAGPWLEKARRQLVGCHHSIMEWSANVKEALIDYAGAEWLVHKHMCRHPERLWNLRLHNVVMPIEWGLFSRVAEGAFGYRLKTLELDENPLKHDGVRWLAHGIKSGKFPALRELSLTDTQLCDDGMRELAQCFEHLAGLHTLELGNNPWGDRGMRFFLRHGHHIKDVQSIEMGGMDPRLSWKMLNTFAEWIEAASGWQHIEHIYLFPPDPPDDPGGIGEPCMDYRRAHEAVRAAVKMRRALVNWEWLRPQSDTEVANAEVEEEWD